MLTGLDARIVPRSLHVLSVKLHAVRTAGHAEGPHHRLAWQAECRRLCAESERDLTGAGLPLSMRSMWQMLWLGAWLGPLGELSYDELPSDIVMVGDHEDLVFAWQSSPITTGEKLQCALRRAMPAFVIVADRCDGLDGLTARRFWDFSRGYLRGIPVFQAVEALGVCRRESAIETVFEWVQQQDASYEHTRMRA